MGDTAEILHPVPYTDLLQRRVWLMAYSNWATVDMHNLIAFSHSAIRLVPPTLQWQNQGGMVGNQNLS